MKILTDLPSSSQERMTKLGCQALQEEKGGRDFPGCHLSAMILSPIHLSHQDNLSPSVRIHRWMGHGCQASLVR